MRTYVNSFLIGTAAVFLLLIVGLTALGLAAAAGDWKSFEIAIGPVRLFAFERDGTTTTTMMGIGVVPVALLAGLANAGAAAILRRRARSA
jgi:hypothetical protein